MRVLEDIIGDVLMLGVLVGFVVLCKLGNLIYGRGGQSCELG
jgi:hypothetical protein